MKKNDKAELARLRAQKKREMEYRNQYAKENYKRLICLFPIDLADELEQARNGEPMSAYILDLIKRDMHKKGLI